MSLRDHEVMPPSANVADPCVVTISAAQQLVLDQDAARIGDLGGEPQGPHRVDLVEPLAAPRQRALRPSAA
ncbi:MAG: hypothetical protein R3D59_11155 [Paracoccaceae bacterium]